MLQYAGSTPNASNPGSKASQNNGPIPIDIMRILESIPQEDNIIRFFERSSDQYEAFGRSVELIDMVHGRNNSGDAEQYPRMSFTTVQLRNCLRDLFSGQHRLGVEILEFSSVRKAWKVSKSASPANTEQLDSFFSTAEDSSGELGNNAAPIVVALYIQGNKVGLTFCDAVNFTLGISEFTDNELLSNVEVALIQLGSLECIIPQSSADANYEKVEEICKNCNIAISRLKSTDFKSNTVEEDLSKLFAEDSSCCAFERTPVMLSAASGILNYLQLMRSDSNMKAFKFTPYDLSAYMKLDDTALRSLHIFPTSTGSRTTSLFGLLNECKTGQGTRLLEQWLRQPLLSKELIEGRQNIIEAFIMSSMVRQNVRESNLRNVPDLSRIIKRLVRGASNLQDIVVLYQVVGKIPAFLEELGAVGEDYKNSIGTRYVETFQYLLNLLQPFIQLVEGMVDFSALERHEYIVRADFDESLKEISDQKEEILNQIEPEFERVARNLGLEMNKKVKLERNNIYGYFFRISRIDANLLSGDEYQELAALKNGIYFVTPFLRGLSLRYDELCRLYASKQSILVKEMLTVTATYRSLFDQLNLTVADLDVCLSLAYVSLMSPKSFVRPTIGGPDLLLKAARHPCLEAQSGVDFIANDVEFQRDGACVQIITGPNMGGKSTYIRQAALITILAQIGCFVPCDSASIPLFDSVMVRVGAGDNIIKGVSTFMAEMLETASILKTATPASFVIIDELGRGTSTSEGLGLAWGVTKYITTKLGCFTFFATHFHELTVLATEYPKLISNLFVDAQVLDGTLTMLYNVKPGICDESFGIHVAELANFPKVVVEMAKLRVAELESKPMLPAATPSELAQLAQFINYIDEKAARMDRTEKKALILNSLQQAPTVLTDILNNCNN